MASMPMATRATKIKAPATAMSLHPPWGPSLFELSHSPYLPNSGSPATIQPQPFLKVANPPLRRRLSTLILVRGGKNQRVRNG
jgi:hypothetical protein